MVLRRGKNPKNSSCRGGKEKRNLPLMEEGREQTPMGCPMEPGVHPGAECDSAGQQHDNKAGWLPC